MGKDPDNQVSVIFSSLKSRQLRAMSLCTGRWFAALSSGFTERQFHGTGGSPAGTVPAASRASSAANPKLAPSKKVLFSNFLGVPQRPLACPHRHHAVMASRRTRQENKPAHAASQADWGGQGIVGNVCKFPCRTATRQPVSAFPSPGTP